MLDISGFDKLSRDLKDAQQALISIDGELTTLNFDPNDPASIESAIQQVEAVLDERLSQYSSNPLVGPLLIDLKKKYRDGILERAASARLEGEDTLTSQTDLFKQINNAVLDLQASELQTYEYPLRTLGRLLQNDGLAEANKELTKDVDFEAFINESPPSRGSFIGTGRLAWPDDPKKVLGLKLILIKKLSEDPDYAIQFGHTYYYSGNKVIAGLHSIVRQLLIPFFRDYKEYVLNRSSFSPRVISQASNKVFVVYGHDGEARETVARFLENAGFIPIILHEQANMGRTIIEKVEANSDVGLRWYY